MFVSCWKVNLNHNLESSAVSQLFLDFSVFTSIHLCINSASFPLCYETESSQHDASTTFFHHGDRVFGVDSAILSVDLCNFSRVTVGLLAASLMNAYTSRSKVNVFVGFGAVLCLLNFMMMAWMMALCFMLKA